MHASWVQEDVSNITQDTRDLTEEVLAVNDENISHESEQISNSDLFIFFEIIRGKTSEDILHRLDFIYESNNTSDTWKQLSEMSREELEEICSCFFSEDEERESLFNQWMDKKLENILAHLQDN